MNKKILFLLMLMIMATHTFSMFNSDIEENIMIQQNKELMNKNINNDISIAAKRSLHNLNKDFMLSISRYLKGEITIDSIRKEHHFSSIMFEKTPDILPKEQFADLIVMFLKTIETQDFPHIWGAEKGNNLKNLFLSVYNEQNHSKTIILQHLLQFNLQ